VNGGGGGGGGGGRSEVSVSGCLPDAYAMN